MNKEKILLDIDVEIMERMERYIKVISDSGTHKENETDIFWKNELGEWDYFHDQNELWGTFPIKDDSLGRSVNWALVRGQGPNTVVMIHHSDTVGTEDYQQLDSIARKPDSLREALLARRVELDEGSIRDLDSGEFVFGHGTADMKGGGAIQLTLLRRLSLEENLNGNLLVLALPDEENLSAGMRSAALLLDELKDRFGLKYQLMINSEPHQRKNPTVGVLTEGSVGKLLPFVYVRGILAHAGQVFSGLNPINLLSAIVRRIELNMDLADNANGETTPPPTCLMMKDSKARYDVSLPRSAFGCFSFMTLRKRPEDILDDLQTVSSSAAEEILTEYLYNCNRYRGELGNSKISEIPNIRILRFSDLVGSEGPTDRQIALIEERSHGVQAGKEGMAYATWSIIEDLLDLENESEPTIVLGFIPPYYPGITNSAYEDASHPSLELLAHLQIFSDAEFGQQYDREAFYTGISDLSYSSFQGDSSESILEANMPLYGRAYSIPFEAIRNNACPCINIGPWGKDFHKISERVHLKDLTETTPRLLLEALSHTLGWKC